MKNDIDEVDEDEEQAEVESGPKDVNFIIKADVSGSVEAIVQSIEHLGNDEVKCNIVGSSVGVPAENDLKMAKITGVLFYVSTWIMYPMISLTIRIKYL